MVVAGVARLLARTLASPATDQFKAGRPHAAFAKSRSVSCFAGLAIKMQAVNFSCPHCSVVLRLQDRMFLGKRIDCPDCGEPIEIVSDAKDTITAEKRAASETIAADTNATGSAAGAPAGVSLSTWLSGTIAAIATPVGIAWSIAGVFAVSMAVAVWPAGDSSKEISSTVPAAGPNHVESKASDATPVEGTENNETPPILAGDPNRELIRQRFTTLGERIQQFADRNGRFPNEPAEAGELPFLERLGWLAELSAETEPVKTMQPLWDRPWRDPLNDRFVRQRIREFQNPAVAEIVSPEGYPAAHIVGISGVGKNAERYPKHDSRAGIFGLNRRTTRDDVTDGLSNTMMVAGVQKNVGAWAAAGPATMRPLTREPYVNGPDGFGTGQHNGMMVLMADGSVRFVSKKIEPVIIRRMAAMADGFPIDPNVPGEPGDKSIPVHVGAELADAGKPAKQQKPADGVAAQQADAKQKQHKAAPAGEPKQNVKGGNRPPIQAAAPAPEPEPKVDVKAVLSQKIVSFRQSKPVAFATLLMQVEEMAGVKIRHPKDGLKPEILQKEVSVSLSNTTVGAILTALVERVGLVYEAQDTGILLRMRDSSDDSAK